MPESWAILASKREKGVGGGILALASYPPKLRQQFLSKWVRAKFRIRDQRVHEKDVSR